MNVTFRMKIEGGIFNNRIIAKEARIIKLGRAGYWPQLCIDDGTLRLDYRDTTETLAQVGDYDGLKADFEARGFKRGTASNHARQVIDFFNP